MEKNLSKSIFRCIKLKPNIPQAPHRESNDVIMYQAGYLEHPMIDGLMLSLDERLYGDLLEYKNKKTGQVFVEGPTEKRFRVMWKKPLVMDYKIGVKKPTWYHIDIFGDGPGVIPHYD